MGDHQGAIDAEIRSAYRAIQFGKDGKSVSDTALAEFQKRIKGFLDDKPNGSKKDNLLGQLDRFIEEHTIGAGICPHFLMRSILL